MKPRSQRETDILAAVEELREAALSCSYSSQADQTFTRCHVCDKVDEHEDDCFMGSVEAWYAKQ